MVSLIRILLIRFSGGIIKYWFMPRYNTLRAHLLGLTLAFLIVLLHQGLFVFNFEYFEEGYDWIIQVDVENLYAEYAILHIILIILWFGLVTYYFGIWALLTLVLLLYLWISPPEQAFWMSFKLSAWWYIAGYLFGIIMATLYNDILYLYMLIFRKKDRKLIFAYDPQKKLNIIKSPITAEEVQVPDVRKEDRLYNFYNINLRRPYTIAFIANPCYKPTDTKDTASTADAIDPRQDPIIKNLDLFLRSVVRALESFHNNEVLGRPEIWSRVRVITIFDKEFGNPIDNMAISATTGGPILSKEGFVQQTAVTDPDFEGTVSPIHETPEGILIDEVLKSEIDRLGGPVKFENIDVVFSLTAMPDFTRASAHFSTGGPNILGHYNFDPRGNLTNSTVVNSHDYENTDVNSHDYEDQAEAPGKVALNILGATQKTFIHEFAHAMSHAQNGAIIDEYFDEGVLLLDNSEASERERASAVVRALVFKIFAVNRQQKTSGTINIPKIYSIYNDSSHEPFIYASDRNHPSAEEYWGGFYPERKESDVYCTMDRRYGRYQFDKLIADYMYDRLMYKIT
jgi:hypothetical protein